MLRVKDVLFRWMNEYMESQLPETTERSIILNVPGVLGNEDYILQAWLPEASASCKKWIYNSFQGGMLYQYSDVSDQYRIL